MSTARLASGRGALATSVFGLALALTLTVARTLPGQAAVAAAGTFLEYYAGVFTLVTLTGAVVFGVVAALRVLPPRPRIVAQALHRASAVTAVGFLVTHAMLKVMEAHARPLDLVVPTSPNWVALGTIAGDLLILAAATGAARGRYAATVRPWAWRILHCTVYLTWPVGLAHGLIAGRPPKPWVTISYLGCAALVIGLLLIRSATTTRHQPPGTAPVPDLSGAAGTSRPMAAAEPPRSGPPPVPDAAAASDPPPATAGPLPTTGPFAAQANPHTDPFTTQASPRTDPFTAQAPPATDPFAATSAPTAEPIGAQTAPPTDPFAAASVPTADPSGARSASGSRLHTTFGTYTPPGSRPNPRGLFNPPRPSGSTASSRPAEPFGTRVATSRPSEPDPPGFSRTERPAPPRPPGAPRMPEDPDASPFFAHVAGAARTPGAGKASGFAREPGTSEAPGASASRAAQVSEDESPRERGRKGKRGRHQAGAVDDQDAAFWASLRAERRDWTRPS